MLPIAWRTLPEETPLGGLVDIDGPSRTIFSGPVAPSPTPAWRYDSPVVNYTPADPATWRVANSGRVADEVAALRSIAARNATPEARLLHQRTNLRGAVAEEYALLTRGMSNNKIRNEVGPVLAGVMDTKTGKLYFGLNKGVGELPDNLVPVMADRIPIASEIPYMKTHGAGTHAEIHALNDAFLARPGAQMDDFLLYTINAGQRGSPTRWGLPVPRCPHCELITNGVQYFPEPLRYGK